MLKDVSEEEIRQKMNKEAFIAFLDDVDTQSRRIKQLEKEHNF